MTQHGCITLVHHPSSSWSWCSAKFDDQSMITSRRPVIALALLAIGLAIFLVDNVSQGWTAIGVAGVLCLVLAIAAQALAIRKARPHH